MSEYASDDRSWADAAYGALGPIAGGWVVSLNGAMPPYPPEPPYMQPEQYSEAQQWIRRTANGRLEAAWPGSGAR